jgi:hypothetical protein
MERFIFVAQDWSRSKGGRREVEGKVVVAVLSVEVVPLRHVFSSSEVMLGDTGHPVLHAE